MKAVVWTRYGPPHVLQLREVEKPTPKDDEVLVKILAATVTKGDCELRSLDLPLMFALPMRVYVGLVRPTRVTIMGSEVAGEIEAVGKDVRSFKPGDQVFGGQYTVEGHSEVHFDLGAHRSLGRAGQRAARMVRLRAWELWHSHAPERSVSRGVTDRQRIQSIREPLRAAYSDAG